MIEALIDDAHVLGVIAALWANLLVIHRSILRRLDKMAGEPD